MKQGGRVLGIVASVALVVGVALWVFADAFRRGAPDGPPEAPTPWQAVGRVLTPDGTPIADAEVGAWWCQGPFAASIAHGRTDASGRFQLALPALEVLSATARTAGALELEARAPGHAQAPAEPYAGQWDPREVAAADAERDGFIVRIEAPLPGPLEATLRLLPGPVLRGRLVDDRGRPATDVGVELRERTSGAALLACTDHDGRFALPARADGAWLLRAVHPRYGEHTSGPHLVADGDLDLGDVPLAGAHTIQGRVVDDEGRPWDGLTLRASETDFADGSIYMVPLPACFGVPGGPARALARTDDDGRFTLQLPTSSSRWRLEVRVSDRFEDLGQVVGSEGAADVLLRWSGQRIRVRILDEHDHPLPGALLRATGWKEIAPPGVPRRPGDGSRAWTHTLALDEDGTCSFFAAPGTSWHLAAEARGAGPVERWFDVTDGSRTSDIDLHLRPAATER